MPLWSAGLDPIAAGWITARFSSPTEPQLAAWPAIAAGGDVLLAAPTGTGKTLAAFLTAISRLLRQAIEGRLRPETAVVYISPLKALANDIEINLQIPLAEIQQRALEAGHLGVDIRTAVRTGDTPAGERAAMLRRPPHILVTTPESLYLLLTSVRGRAMLRTTRTVIVDEIHALAGNKRGAHLALSLERLDALAAPSGPRPQRIGLSATVQPLSLVADFLTGGGPVATLAIPRRRPMDVAVEIPQASPLGPIATNDQWEERADRLAELARQHRATLIFVSTRSLAERLAHRLEAHLGAGAVAAHHGSLSRKIRLRAEQRFKRGELPALVATASLELGLDIGHVDLVCQIGSPRSFSVAWQRIGRAGHFRGAIPKGRLFPLTRDDLVECAAIARALRRPPAPASQEPDRPPCDPPPGDALDALAVPPWPRDVLAQQIVAAVAAETLQAGALYSRFRRAYPYRDLPRAEFDTIVAILSAGISERRGRSGAWLHRYQIPGPAGSEIWLRARRGARLAALTNGGAIAEQAAYAVIAAPENLPVGSLDEDFAIETHAGDIILLGSTSWRIQGIETGRVWVENAHGAPPTVPFWKGEALGRTPELSAALAALRQDILAPPTSDAQAGSMADGRADGMASAEAVGGARGVAGVSPADADPARAPFPGQPDSLAWLQSACGLSPDAAAQLCAYVQAGHAQLGALPSPTEVIAERFFDDGGGMQLVIHAPFGSRINRAWGMALRKRFCRGFDFELQAAAGENGLLLSLSEQHSFPLETIFTFLNRRTAGEILTQAVLQAPLFPTRWRWTVARALAMLRFRGGRKTPPQIQRMRAEDLLAAAFPRALGCQDNHGGDIEVPAHPYVQEALRDCLHEALDLDGLTALLEGLETGKIRFRAVDRPAPSVLAAEIVNSAPHTFLDDAPLEERRARAVQLNHAASPAVLDPAAIAAVRHEAWPAPADADELHDLLLSLRWLPQADANSDWLGWLEALALAGRVQPHGDAVPGWLVDEAHAAVQASGLPESEVAAAVRGWMEILGPVTAPALALRLGFTPDAVTTALLALESDGQVLRGHFTGARTGAGQAPGPPESTAEEWCDRRLLARIHRRMLRHLRAEIEPVPPDIWRRFLARWQHLEPETRLSGAAGLRLILHQVQGWEAAAADWERVILPSRLRDYDPAGLDQLCLAGEIAWARLWPSTALGAVVRRRTRPARNAPVAFYRREDASWILPAADHGKAGTGIGSGAAGGGGRTARGGGSGAGVPPAIPSPANRTPSASARLSPAARTVLAWLSQHGALFFADLARLAAAPDRTETLVPSQIENALWELAVAGEVTADGFDNLRALLDPKRRRGEGSARDARPRHSAGRWSRIVRPTAAPAAGTSEEAALAERVLDQLLRRYGILFRAAIERERLPVSWYAILQAARRWEARGLARGGRFVSGFPGEQFALPAAVEALRAVRRLPAPADLPPLAPSDPFFTLAPAFSSPALAAAALTSPISPLPALAVP